MILVKDLRHDDFLLVGHLSLDESDPAPDVVDDVRRPRLFIEVPCPCRRRPHTHRFPPGTCREDVAHYRLSHRQVLSPLEKTGYFVVPDPAHAEANAAMARAVAAIAEFNARNEGPRSPLGAAPLTTRRPG